MRRYLVAPSNATNWPLLHVDSGAAGCPLVLAHGPVGLAAASLTSTAPKLALLTRIW